MAELHKNLNEAGELSLHEMGDISSPSIDITQLVENARDAVKGKSATLQTSCQWDKGAGFD